MSQKFHRVQHLIAESSSLTWRSEFFKLRIVMHRFSALLTMLCLYFCGSAVNKANASAFIITDVHATVDKQHNRREVFIIFDSPIPANSRLATEVSQPYNYSVNQDVADPTGVLLSATDSQAIQVTHVEIGRQGAETLYSEVVLVLAGAGFGSGTVSVHSMSTTEGTIAATTKDWHIHQAYDLHRSTKAADVRLDAATPVVDFRFEYTTNFRFEPSHRSVSRDWISVEGSVPVTDPRDIHDTNGSNADASGDVGGFVQMSLARRWYDGKNIHGIGLVSRTSSRINGNETVINVQPFAALATDGRTFAGLEGEGGYRDGHSEWKGLTEKGPDAGNVVGRLGGVLEWAPQLGPINRDLG